MDRRHDYEGEPDAADHPRCVKELTRLEHRRAGVLRSGMGLER